MQYWQARRRILLDGANQPGRVDQDTAAQQCTSVGAHLRLHQLARRPCVLGEHHQRGGLARVGPGVTGAPAASLGPSLPYPKHDPACTLALCAARPAALCALQRNRTC